MLIPNFPSELHFPIRPIVLLRKLVKRTICVLISDSLSSSPAKCAKQALALKSKQKHTDWLARSHRHIHSHAGLTECGYHSKALVWFYCINLGFFKLSLQTAVVLAAQRKPSSAPSLAKTSTHTCTKSTFFKRARTRTTTHSSDVVRIFLPYLCS